MSNTESKNSSLRIVNRSKYSLLYFLEGFDDRDLSLFHLLCTNILENPRHVIVNCLGTQSFSDRLLEMIHFLGKQLLFASKKLKLTYVSENLSQQIVASRFGESLVQTKDLFGALQDLEAAKPTHSETNFIRAFVHATMRTFYIQIQTQCWRGKIFIKSDSSEGFLGDVNGLILVTGEKFSYEVVLSFPQATFLQLVERTLGEKISEITDANSDSATELLNIIFGQAKRTLNEEGARIVPQFPKLHLGRKLPGSEAKASSKKIIVVIPFNSDLGEFFVQIAFPDQLSIQLLS